jgi:predicted DNA-binding antitoxin AbrB/MazE fold protein
MAQIIRAVYEHGQLRPLDPLALTDGQEVHLAILSEQEQVRSALAGDTGTGQRRAGR